MHSLPLFHRIAGERVVLVGDGQMAGAKRRLIERAGGLCCGEDEPAARLAFVALDEAEQAQATAHRLKARGLLVNVADRPELCDFTLPSVLERGDVLVAVSTGGASAVLAKQLRLRLETLLPPSLGALAAAIQNKRAAIRERWPQPEHRRHALDLALAEGGALDPLDTASPERIGAWMGSADAAPAPAWVEFALTSADPDDLSLRQARLLGMADTIVHDRDVPAAILARARADADRRELSDCHARDARGLTLVIRSSRAGGGEPA